MRMAQATLLPLALLWLLLMVVSLLTRSYVPIDETRYVSVAWEMWLHSDFLVPHLNGETYSHKPPLLFWLFQLGWWVFGVNEWWPRLLPPLFGLGSLFLTAALARRLWPRLTMIQTTAPWVLLGALFWTLYTTVTMFDMLMVFFTLLGLLAVKIAAEGRQSGWWLLGLAIGLGVLAKGPVILLLLLPTALLAPWWLCGAMYHEAVFYRPVRWGRWYLGILAALLLGAAVALLWAIPAALSGGKDYADAIFWGQTAKRMVNSFAHKRGFFWYLPLLPLLLFPWLLWPKLWVRLTGLFKGVLDAGTRFCLAWMVPVFLALSLISGKQVHYLLPIFPAFALLVARALSQTEQGAARRALWLPGLGFMACGALLLGLPWWMDKAGLPGWTEDIETGWGAAVMLAGLLLVFLRLRGSHAQVMALTLTSVVLVVVVHLAVLSPAGRAYDMRPMAHALARLQAQGKNIAHAGKYAGQYHFLGRLEHPLMVIKGREAAAWARRNPEGYVLVYYKRRQWPQALKGALLVQDYHTGGMALWQGRALTRQLAASQ